MAWGVPKIGTVAERNTTGALPLTEPAGIAQGDLMIACIGFRGNTPFSAPSGWTLVQQQNSGDVDATNGIASAVMFYCVRGASAPNLTFNQSAGDNVNRGCIIAYSGGASSPLDTSSSNTLASASATVTTGSLTTAEAGELIVAMVAAGDTLNVSAFDAATDPTTASGATDTTTAPTNGTWIERVDSSTALGADLGFAVADAIRATAGSTGTIQATVTASARHAMIAAAFKLASEPPPATGSGSPVATLSKTASGTAVQKFNASGSPVATLSKTASGTATLKFNGSGSPVATLSRTASGTATMTPDPSTGSGSPVATLSSTASGTAVLKFNASGSPVATLSAFTTSSTAVQRFNAAGAPTANLAATASGTATMTPDAGGPPPVNGSGSPVATLSATTSGTAVEQFNASGSPVATLSPTASGTAAQRFSATGADVATLSATASGTATMTTDPSTGSGSPVKTLSAFAAGTATSGVGPPAAVGGIKFIYTDDEEEKKDRKRRKRSRHRPEVPEAEPLPDVQEVFPMLGNVQVDPETWKRAAQGLELTRSVKPVARAGQPIDEDEEIEDLLHVLAAIF